jgi:glucosylceramidase
LGRPGPRRIYSSSGYDELDTVAFRNADDGSVALIVVNSAKEERGFDVRVGQRSFSYRLPPASVATFTWK